MRQYVRKSNTLVTAPYTLSLQEQRVLLCCLAQIPKDAPASDEIFYTVTTADIIRLSGISATSAYAELKRAAEGLKRKEVRLTDGPQGDPLDDVVITNWAQAIKLSKKGGIIGIQFPKVLLPYLSELNKQFTYYELADVLKMSSTYSIRLYELMRQWRAAGSVEIPLSELRVMFELQDKYPEYYEFKRRVLDPALKEINDLSPINVMMEPVKAGKSVEGLLFDISQKSKPAKQEPEQLGFLDLGEIVVPPPKRRGRKRLVTEQQLSELARPGESREAAMLRLNVRLRTADA